MRMKTYSVRNVPSQYIHPRFHLMCLGFYHQSWDVTQKGDSVKRHENLHVFPIDSHFVRYNISRICCHTQDLSVYYQRHRFKLPKFCRSMHPPVNVYANFSIELVEHTHSEERSLCRQSSRARFGHCVLGSRALSTTEEDPCEVFFEAIHSRMCSLGLTNCLFVVVLYNFISNWLWFSIPRRRNSPEDRIPFTWPTPPHPQPTAATNRDSEVSESDWGYERRRRRTISRPVACSGACSIPDRPLCASMPCRTLSSLSRPTARTHREAQCVRYDRGLYSRFVYFVCLI
jgi:hypothetical protein